MGVFVDLLVDSGRDPGPTVEGQNRAGPYPPYPAEKLEREQAAFDLADAAQAATQAAILADQGEAADSRRLDLLAQQLYDRADNHRRHADQAHHTVDDLRRLPSGETPGKDRGHLARPPRVPSC